MTDAERADVFRAALARRDAALIQIIDLCRDEPGGLNIASRVTRLACDALGWESE